MNVWDPTAQKSLLEWALHLQKLGLSLIPVKPGTKNPAVTWKEFQTRRAGPEQITNWLLDTGNQLGIVTGEVSGIVVIDTDNAEAEMWARNNLPDTPIMCRTLKGWHRYYRWPGAPVRNGVKLKTDVTGLALDLRGDGGYVMAPGSLHPDGDKYVAWGRWNGFGDLPAFRKTWEPLERARLWLGKRDPATEGQGGDTFTFSTACSLREFGLTEGQVLELLLEWNRTCNPPWSEEDLAEKARNAFLYGQGVPGCKLGQTASAIASIRSPQAPDPVKEAKTELLEKVYSLPQIYRMLAQAKASGTDTTGFVYAGIPAVDDICQGFRPGQLILIAARPSQGKSAFALQMARSISRKFGPVYFESLEMGAEDMGFRAASQALQVEAEDVTSDQLMRLASREEEMVFISFAGKASFKSRVRQFLFDHPSTCCLFVDYLGYLKNHKKSAYDEVNEISQGLKETAVEYNLPVFALHQLSRDNEKEKRAPRMEDLRDSGCLEQDADKVLLIHRPERHDPNGAVEILVEKNRGGPTGIAHLSWRGRTTSFLTKGQAVLNPQKVEFEEMDMDLV